MFMKSPAATSQKPPHDINAPPSKRDGKRIEIPYRAVIKSASTIYGEAFFIIAVSRTLRNNFH